MGALLMSAFGRFRKRRADNRSSSDSRFSSLHSRQSYPERRFDNRATKKLKYSDSMSNSALSDQPVASKSAAFRLQQYPASINMISRQVHAPCRSSRFGLRATSGNVSNREHSADIEAKGKLADNYEKSMYEAIGTLRYVGKGKQVIDVDDYQQKEQENVSEDLSVEEVEVVEYEKKGRLREHDWKSMDIDRTIGDQSFQPSCSSVVSEDFPNANLKSQSAGKVLDVESVEWDYKMRRMAVKEKLYNSVDRISKNVKDIEFQIALTAKHLSTVQLQPTAKKPTKEVVKEPFVPLTKQEESEINIAFSNAKRKEILVTHKNSNIEITGELLQCLRPGAWLNDEVINLYLELLKEREKKNPKKFLKCHFFNTFFYKKLIGGDGYDFKSVRRWTTQRKLGYCLIDCDKIFVPIHKETHWCLAVINKKDEKFQYLDSLKGRDRRIMKILARYIVDEVNDKMDKVLDVSSWKEEYVDDLPLQKNGFDCGVFMIKYADFYSRDVGLCFGQEHMPYFRRRTAKEILRLKAD